MRDAEAGVARKIRVNVLAEADDPAFGPEIGGRDYSAAGSLDAASTADVARRI